MIVGVPREIEADEYRVALLSVGAELLAKDGRTSSQALCNATLPYARELAALGVDAFLARGLGYARALNMRDGRITYADVAEAFPDLPRADSHQ